MLTMPIPIAGKDVQVGMRVRVVYRDGDLKKTREGRITKITKDYLALYLWVGTNVIAVIPQNEYCERALMDYEVFLLEDFMTEEQNALRRALYASNIEVDGNVLRGILETLDTLGFRVTKYPPKPSIQPTIKQEVQSRRPAA